MPILADKLSSLKFSVITHFRVKSSQLLGLKYHKHQVLFFKQLPHILEITFQLSESFIKMIKSLVFFHSQTKKASVKIEFTSNCVRCKVVLQHHPTFSRLFYVGYEVFGCMIYC
ncbi:hypothetical protein M758_1G122900 [Ceratodon purpureus]|nr:hypothetical protein M758_1G122900 [Ceratodon purpureus]